MDNIGFRKFTSDDIENMTAIMKAAFEEDSTLFREIQDGPPGYDDGSFLRKYALDPKSDSYCIHFKGKDIGAVIVWTNQKLLENFLGCIFIDPSLRKMGLGKRVWDEIEKMYPDVKVWRTETPLCSVRNLNYYINKCGFMAHAITDSESYEEAQVQFVKYMK
ncbi:MAG: GNAT family N-acetyltransferase [Roseburia sp.]